MNQYKIEQLDFNLLKVFEAVYRERHISRAADSLFLTPSAVSHAIRRLREHLGDPLFIRDGRSMMPTAVCLRMAPALLDTLNKLRQILQQWGSFDPLQTQLNFRIGLIEAIESSFISPLLQVLRQEAPHASLTSMSMQRRDLAQELAAGRVDLVVDIGSIVQDSIRHCPLLTASYAVLMRHDHPLADNLTLESYLQARHIAVSARTQTNAYEDVELLHQGLKRDIGLRCHNFYTACRVAGETDYLLTIPDDLARHIGVGAQHRLCPLPFFLPPVSLNLYWHENSEYDAANVWLRQLINRTVLNMVF